MHENEDILVGEVSPGPLDPLMIWPKFEIKRTKGQWINVCLAIKKSYLNYASIR